MNPHDLESHLEVHFDPPFDPLRMLTPTLAAAAEYIARHNQSDVAMCAYSVLAASVLVAQGHADVRHLDGTAVPLSLYLLVSAPSGARKSANDNLAFRCIREWLIAERERGYARLEQFESDHKVWQVKRKAAERQLSKAVGGGDTEATAPEESLRELMRREPKRTKWAELILSNVTHAALGNHLDKVFPIVGVISDEAGVVFATDALSKHAQTMWNSLWDRGDWESTRLTRGQQNVKGARCSASLQVQPAVLDDFGRRRGALVHENGLFARFLFMMAGLRFDRTGSEFLENPRAAFEAWEARLMEGLVAFREGRVPARICFELTEAALALLSEVSRALNRAACKGEWFEMMPGHVAKGAQIIVRVAAVMHWTEAAQGRIDVDTVRAAIHFVCWALNQQRRCFFPLTQLDRDAIELRDWLNTKAVPKFLKQNNGFVPSMAMLNSGPSRLRHLKDLMPVLQRLQSVGIIRISGTPGGSWGIILKGWLPEPVYAPPPTGQRRIYSARLNDDTVPAPDPAPTWDDPALLWPGFRMP